jgi:alpha-tubulin suppressor-like RCC1 family protein
MLDDFMAVGREDGHAGNGEYAMVAVGRAHTVALKRDGTLWAWGCNEHGQLGDGSMMDRDRPVQVGEDSDWIQVTAGEFHTVAVKADGSVWAWGFRLACPVRVGPNTERILRVSAQSAFWN